MAAAPPPAAPAPAPISISVKHGKATHKLEGLDAGGTTIEELKAVLQSLTDVPADMMKLLAKGKALTTGTLAANKVKAGAKLMLMGNPAAAVAAANLAPEGDGGEGLFDDFELDFLPCAEEIEHHEDAQRKLRESIAATEVHFINAPRRGKALLVLDLDHCLLHFSRTLAEEGREAEMKRPFMDDFLQACYAYYDLVIWSQTHWQWVEQKLTALGMLTHPGYKLCFVLDKSAMFRIGVRNPRVTAKHPDEFRKISVKPLEVVWAKLREQFGARDGADARGAHNTVQVDDLSRNFTMNPQNGLRCTAYSRKDKAHDTELAVMARYLVLIAQRERCATAAQGEGGVGGGGGGSSDGDGGAAERQVSFGHLDHNHWLRYLEQHEGELSMEDAASAAASAVADTNGGAGQGGGASGDGAWGGAMAD